MPNEFRHELRRLAAGLRDPLVSAKLVDPASYGWLRRPDRDQPGVAAWERPDGTLRGIAVEGADASEMPRRRRSQ